MTPIPLQHDRPTRSDGIIGLQRDPCNLDEFPKIVGIKLPTRVSTRPRIQALPAHDICLQCALRRESNMEVSLRGGNTIFGKHLRRCLMLTRKRHPLRGRLWIHYSLAENHLDFAIERP